MKSLLFSVILLCAPVAAQARDMIVSKDDCRVNAGEKFCVGNAVHIVTSDIHLYDPRVPYTDSAYSRKYRGYLKSYGVADNLHDLYFDELNDRTNISGWISAFYADGTVQVRYRYKDGYYGVTVADAVVDIDKISRRTKCSHDICEGDFVYLGARVDPMPPTPVHPQPIGPIRGPQDIMIGQVIETFSNGKIRIFRNNYYTYESWVQPAQIMREVKCVNNVCKGADVKVAVEYTDGSKGEFSRTVKAIYSNGTSTAVLTRQGVIGDQWIDPIEFIRLK